MKNMRIDHLAGTIALAPPDDIEGKVEERDVVDRGLEHWKREFPDMDLATEGLVSRIHKISRYIDKAMRETAGEFGLAVSDWDVLSSLRKQGPPYCLKPSELCTDMMLTSGAMTSRLDKLEEQGLVTRTPDPDDRRGVLVQLTDKGRDVWGQAVEVQASKEKFFADVLTDEEKDLTNDMLRKMLLTFQKKSGKVPRRALIEESEE
jgi:DNA-binding MarR family transcriptional regulator